MSLHGIDIAVTCKTQEILDILRKNREQHATVLEEARHGYLKEAMRALTDRIDDLKGGKLVGLHFDLMAPTDHLDVYDTVIRTLELHQDDTIELDANEVRQLIEDEWDWSGHWLMSNSYYSASARDIAHKKGIDVG